LSSGRIALGYAVIGVLWIAFSDRVVAQLKLPPFVNTIKGAAFVVVTASLLYFTIRRLVQTAQLTSRELRESQEHLEEAQSLGHMGSWQLDVVRNRISCSKEVFRIIDIPPGTPLTYESFLGVVHPDDRALVETSWKDALRGAAYDFEHRILVGGEVRWVRARARLELDGDGKPLAAIGTVQDITERRRAEEALRESEAYLTEAQSLSHTGSWAFDVATDRYVYVSEECFRIFGLDARDGLPTRESVLRRIHTDDSEQVDRAFRKSIDEKVDTSSEFRVLLPHGAVRTLQVTRHPVLNRAEEVVKLVGTAVDVTEQKRAEEELRESETRFRTFVDHAGDALFIQDLEQAIIVDVNREACESLGYTREELIGTTPHAFHLESDRPQMQAAHERAATGEAVAHRHWHRRKDGSLFPVEVRTTVFSYGARRFLLNIARDITDRLQAEEQRERLRQLEADLAHINRISVMGELAASIAHEINQPLSALVANGSACLRWLTREAPDLDEAREAARRIIRDGNRAAEVIAGVRALTRRAVAPRQELDLNATIREVLALVGDQARRNHVLVRTQFANDLAPVSGDRVQVQQVVLNLVMNGIEAMSTTDARARELVITTRNVAADQVQVTVEDSGIGLDPKVMAKIFEPFYTTKPGGMGMGLSISRSILQAHGGRLWATARDGPGASLQFTLSRYNQEASSAVGAEA
jgi:PAS domain S-box-containing protein